MSHEHEKFEGFELEVFGDREVTEFADTPIPKFLLGVYMILPIWGIFWWSMFWDGSAGWLDRGHWHDLQDIAKTTYAARTAVVAPDHSASPAPTEQPKE
jgi:hypothetical protein